MGSPIDIYTEFPTPTISSSGWGDDDLVMEDSDESEENDLRFSSNDLYVNLPRFGYGDWKNVDLSTKRKSKNKKKIHGLDQDDELFWFLLGDGRFGHMDLQIAGCNALSGSAIGYWELKSFLALERGW